jgi:glucose-6-phosphate 1-epimerase
MKDVSPDGWILPGAVRLEPGRNGLPRIAVATPLAEAHIYLHGAHVAHFCPRVGGAKEPFLFMSGSSWFEPGKPIRGGIPVVFPWFGRHRTDPAAPQHGFARLREWSLCGAEALPGGVVAVTLGLDSDDATRVLWPHDFRIEMRVEVGSMLSVELAVTNRSPVPFTYEEALHTYLALADARQAVIEGLDGPYVSTIGGGWVTHEDSPGPVFLAAETDRIYLGNRACVTVRDPAGRRALVVDREGSDAAVLWNPWIAKAKAMPDFGDDEWLFMVCVEACNVAEHAVTLAPGATHRLCTTIRAESQSVFPVANGESLPYRTC